MSRTSQPRRGFVLSARRFSAGRSQFALTILLALTIALFCATLARAQAPEPDDQVHVIAKQLNCPTCGGRNLADCPTDTCTQWKQEIKSQLEQGKTPQEVMQYFNVRFGPTVLQEPPKEGAVLVLWVLPVIGLIALAAGGVVVLRRVTAHKPAVAMPDQPATAEPADAYVARLEEEVRKS
jgi:cytochrome c-type biogenesis protein CcmH